MKSLIASLTMLVGITATPAQEQTATPDCTRFTMRKVALGMTIDELKEVKASVVKPLVRLPIFRRFYPDNEVRVVFDAGPKSKQQMTAVILGADGNVRAAFIFAESDHAVAGTIIRGKATGEEIHDALVAKLGPPVVARHITGSHLLGTAFKTTEVPQYMTIWEDEACSTGVAFLELSQSEIDGFLGSGSNREASARAIEKIIWIAPLSDVRARIADRSSDASKAVE